MCFSVIIVTLLQEDRAAHFNKNVVKAFYTAGNLYEVGQRSFMYEGYGNTHPDKSLYLIRILRQMKFEARKLWSDTLNKH